MFLKNEHEKRKSNSILILKKNKIPFIKHLPVIESENDTIIRSKKEICERAICLAFVAPYAEGLEKEVLLKKIEEFKVQDQFTKEEKEFFELDNFDDSVKAKFIWRYESLWTLLWSLSYVDQLELPTDICDVPFSVKTIADQGRDNFISNAVLRSKKEILDQADLIYRIHWATTDARINNQDMPAGLNNSTVYERHYSLNWIIQYCEQNWDDVCTNT